MAGLVNCVRLSTKHEDLLAIMLYKHFLHLCTITLFSGMLIATAIAQSQSEKPPVGELLYPLILSEGFDAAVIKYKELQAEATESYNLGADALNSLGYKLLNEEMPAEAVSIFKLNTEIHPQLFNVWDSLGEGYLALRQNEQAIKQYRKVLEMLDRDTTLTPLQENFVRNNAETNLLIAGNFETPAESDLHYVSFHGGVPAGKWDLENIVEYKNRAGIKLSYEGHNLYLSPVPGNVEESLTGRNPADVSTGFVGGDYRRFIKKGLIADISNLWSENEWDKVFPAVFKRIATYDEKQFFIPMAFQWNPVWYRKDIFEKHSLTPPATWDELLTLCEQIRDLGYTPFTIAVDLWPPPTARWFTILNLRLNGPEFHEQVMTGIVPFTDQKIRSVFDHWQQIFRAGAFADSSFTNNYQDGNRDITTGNAVMYNIGEWIFESLSDEDGAKLDFFSFPEINPDVTPSEIVHTYGAFITTDNSNSDEAKKILTWLAGTGSQQNNIEANSRIVANQEVDHSLYTDVQKRILRHINDTEAVVPLFEMNTHPEFARKSLVVLQKFWEHPEDIETALNKLEEARKEVFGK